MACNSHIQHGALSKKKISRQVWWRTSMKVAIKQVIEDKHIYIVEDTHAFNHRFDHHT